MSVLFGREREADQLGIQYLWNTGYDPNAFVAFFEKLLEQEKSKPGRLAGWFRTHPSTEDRIVASLDEERYLPEKDNYMIDTSEFDRVKSRLQSIDNAEKSEEATSGTKDQKRPTLKRRTDSGSQQPGDTGGGDDGSQPKSRPTLKRPTDPSSTDPNNP